MEPKINKIAVISTLIILFLISIPGVYAFYFTDWKNENRSHELARRQVIPEFQEDSRMFSNRIVLRKDKGITVDKNRLVFKGLKDDMICLDVYLLELDPEYAYPRYIPKADVKRHIRIGDSMFRLLKVSRHTLQLKRLDVYRT